MGVADELQRLYDNIVGCTLPEEVFGNSATEDVVKKTYRKMQFICSPDKAAKDKESQYIANEAAATLNLLYAEAKERFNQGIYGQRDHGTACEETTEFEIKTAHSTYQVLKTLAEGDYATIFYAEKKGTKKGDIQKVCIKVINDPADNDLMLNEFNFLKTVSHKHLPVFFDDAFITTDKQRAIVYSYIDGIDLVGVRNRHKNGIPQEHMVWVLERCLSGLGAIHNESYFHGNIEPGNIMVRVRDHSCFLIDFLATSRYDSPIAKFSIHTEAYSPPEVLEKKAPTPSSDIYSLGKSMIYLLGGNPTTKEIPHDVDPRITRFLRQMTQEDALARPREAWGLWHELSDLRLEVFGQRRQFLNLNM